MKKLYCLLVCLLLVPMLFADTETDAVNPQTPLQAKGPDVTIVPVVDMIPQVQPANRALLYEQVGDTAAGNAYACQMDTVYPFEADLVDDVVPTGTWNVDTVEMWMGHWGAWVGWNNVPHVNFLVYPDNAGVPADSPIVELVIQQGTYTATPSGRFEKITMPLPSTVVLTSGARVWLECQPWHSFAVNGQSGNQASAAGFGNGQQFYYRFPVLGVNVWQTSSAGGWGAQECFFRIYGTTGGSYTDAATTAINAPPAIINPNTTIAPAATYRNNSTTQQTFDAYYTIDSSGTQIWAANANLTLPASTDTMITWTNWTSGPNDGITYDITAWVVLSGDENPANDTLTAQTQTQSVYWKIYNTMPAATYYNAVATLDVSGAQKVYSIGGYLTMNAIYAFDCASETWSTSSVTLNTGVQRTAVGVVDGKVYVCAGADAAYAALNVMQVFDPVAGTVTSLTNVPTATQFHCAVAWKDTLVYVLGGQSGSIYYNLVQIYDPASDSWTSGTPMPSTNRSFSAGIFGDTIYVAGGYNGGYIAGAWMGIINPANPTQITWTAIPNIPIGASGLAGRSRLQGACDAWGHYYFVGGDDHGVVAVDCHYYDPGDNLWHQQPDKPTGMTNTQAACFVDPLDGGTFFCAGGYTGAAGNATEGLVNLGQTGIVEIPGLIDLNKCGFAAMANPVKGIANIAFTINHQAHVTLKVYDRSGRIVKQLVDQSLPTGKNVVSWNTEQVANGVYFLKLDVDGQSDTYKLVLIK